MAKTVPVNQLSRREEEKKVFEEFATRYQESIGNPDAKVEETTSVTETGEPALPFQDENQNVVLLNLSRGSFRVCGAFPSVQALTRHFESAGGLKAYGDVSIFHSPMHKKFLLCSSFDKQCDGNYTLKKIEKITEAYLQSIAQNNREFQENKELKKQGQVDMNKKRIQPNTEASDQPNAETKRNVSDGNISDFAISKFTMNRDKNAVVTGQVASDRIQLMLSNADYSVD